MKNTCVVLVVNSSSVGTESELSNQQLVWIQYEINKTTMFQPLEGTEIYGDTTYHLQ